MEHPMNTIRKTCLVAFSCLLCEAGLSREVGGLSLPESIKVGDKTLTLNGAGLRTKYIIGVKVYVAGLYLESVSRDAAAVVSSEQVRRVQLTFLRALDREQITDAIGKGFERNSKEQMSALKARLEKLQGYIPDVAAGDKLEITYVPGKGTTLTVKGEEKGTIEGKDFSDALFSVWLGRDPVDEDLKKALLGD
jgi:hypothetical protein